MNEIHVSIFKDILKPIFSLIERRHQKKQEEKKAWLAQVEKMRAQLSSLAPVCVSFTGNLRDDLEIFASMEEIINKLYAGMQGTFRSIHRASRYSKQFGWAYDYVRSLRSEEETYNSEDFRKFYKEAYSLADALLCRELGIKAEIYIVFLVPTLRHKK